MIDLHIHTNASDGELSPKELVDEAVKKGVAVIAITDHDTVEGIQAALDYSADKCIGIVPGIELSCEESRLGFDEVHVLGLFLDFKNRELIKLTERIKGNRIEQKKRMIKKLNKLGFDISFSEVRDLVGYSFGRPHIASILFKKYPSQFESIQDVFDRFLGIGKPAYVEREYKIDVKSAIDIIKKAKGVTFLAHPGVYNDKDAIHLIDYFKKLGGQGMETNYPYNVNRVGVTKEESDRKNQLFKKLAKEKELMETGGTDFHGSIRKVDIGECGISISLFQKLKSYKNTLNRS